MPVWDPYASSGEGIINYTEIFIDTRMLVELRVGGWSVTISKLTNLYLEFRQRFSEVLMFLSNLNNINRVEI